jgi:hypothetical protein
VGQAGYESKEYERLVKRGFKPYSKGHRMMYEHAIDYIKKAAKPFTIFEAGFGIGWGLNRMLEEGIIESYVGCEPNTDSFKYTEGNHGLNPRVDLYNLGFEECLAHGEEPLPQYNAAFCIEVIEHVPLDEQLAFLKGLRSITPRLWLSTPDKDRVPSEGVRTMKGWVALIKEAGFESVDVNMAHWTYLYECRA